MKFETKYHGTIQFNEDEIIYFKNGLPGFEELKKFIILPVEDNEFFNILHSTENNEVGFIVVSPFNVVKDYEFDLNEDKLKQLKIRDYSQVSVYNTVTLNSNIKKITVNLRAPIIINIEEKLGEQVILNDSRYLIKHPLIKEE
ncbi:flagellar assembly protein FliW [Clostridium tepidiprofundi]|nr:flagellar assembly protein FliW [Clostridium tepidiprofundi]